MALGKSNVFPNFFGNLSVMDRYITKELTLPFLFGLGLFTSLALAIGQLFELVRRVTESGLPVAIAIQVLLLKMPSFMALAFPMSVLLASLMAYSRLSSDSELTALRSIGISVYRLVIPAVIFSLIITGLTFLANELVVPAANYRATVLLEKALNKEKLPYRERNLFFPEYTKFEDENGNKREVLTRLFYAEQFNGETMEGLTVLDRSREGLDQIVTAQSASWNIADNRWDFFDGTIYLISPDGSYRNILRFDQQQLQLPRTPLDLAQRGRDYGEMNIAQAQEYLEVVQLSGDVKKIRKLRVRIQEKYAFPFVCVAMGLIGSALGTRPQTTGRGKSFGICVFLIFSYYLLTFISSNLGVAGVFTPFMAAWLPTLSGIGAGGVLLLQGVD